MIKKMILCFTVILALAISANTVVFADDYTDSEKEEIFTSFKRGHILIDTFTNTGYYLFRASSGEEEAIEITSFLVPDAANAVTCFDDFVFSWWKSSLSDKDELRELCGKYLIDPDIVMRIIENTEKEYIQLGPKYEPKVIERDGVLYIHRIAAVFSTYDFDFENVEIIKTGEGKATINFRVFNSEWREEDAKDHENQSVNMVYDNGSWKICGGSFYNDRFIWNYSPHFPDDIPDTGENTDIIIFSVIAAIALLGMGTVILKGKRTKAAD